MENEQLARIDGIEKMQQEIVRAQEKSREQMAKMMEMMMSLAKGKGVEDPQMEDPIKQEKLRREAIELGSHEGMHRMCDMLEERLRAIEGSTIYGNIDVEKLSLVPDLVLPVKFKVPDFDKYDGTKCPLAHITMFCQKMAGHTHNEKLLIHCFQDSLIGSAARWYVQLDRGRIHSWKDLARAFIAQYQHVKDMAPDRLFLQNMEKRATESFREYAQRWRDIAAQVQPPLTEKETTILFVNTLKAPYYERMIGNVTKNFADMVLSGEIIEYAIKSGKIEWANTMRGATFNNESQDVQAVTNEKQYESYTPYPMQQAQHLCPYPYQSIPQNGFQPNFCPQSLFTPPNNPKKARNCVKRLPIPISKLLPFLIKNQYLVPMPLKTTPNPAAKSYEPNSKCEYHMGEIGHSTEKCRQLKENVEELISSGALTQELIEQWKSASP